MRQLLTAAGATALASTLALPAADAAGVIHACVQRDAKDGAGRGAVRVVAAGEACAPTEERVTWNERGPKGERGRRGKQGVPGPDALPAEAAASPAEPPARGEGALVREGPPDPG